jgi:hypothetical protein
MNKLGEIDVKIRYDDLLLSSMAADTKKEAVLRWPNKEDTLAADIRSDAIVSTLVQRTFEQSLGFGEVKLSGDSTTSHSLCLDTLKLTILPRSNI